MVYHTTSSLDNHPTIMSYSQPVFQPPREPMRIIQAEVAEGKVYSVFAEMIMHYSSLFRITLSDGTTEAYDITVTLPRPAWTSVFGFVVDWMMNDRSLKSTEVDPPVREYFNDKLIYEDHFHPTVRECIGIWLLADYLGMPELQNYMITHLVEESNLKRLSLAWHGLTQHGSLPDPAYHVPEHVLTWVWDNTVPKSALRKFLIAVVCHPGTKKDTGFFMRLRPDISSDFLKHYDQRNSSVLQTLDNPQHNDRR